MVITLHLVLLIVAAFCFLMAWFKLYERFDFLAAGLFFLTLAFIF